MKYIIMSSLFVSANHDFVSLSLMLLLDSASLFVPALTLMIHLMQPFKLCQTSSHIIMQSSYAMGVRTSGLYLKMPMDHGVMLLLVN